METITVTDPLTNKSIEFVVIDRGNGEFTSMLKSDYDEQQAHLTESLPPEA